MSWDLVEACGILLSEFLIHLITLISVALEEKEVVSLGLGHYSFVLI